MTGMEAKSIVLKLSDLTPTKIMNISFEITCVDKLPKSIKRPTKGNLILQAPTFPLTLVFL